GAIGRRSRGTGDRGRAGLSFRPFCRDTHPVRWRSLVDLQREPEQRRGHTMSISETFRYEGDIQVDTSNFRKHTSDNHVQRKLIDRFHERITAIVSGYQPETLLDAGCGEGFVADILQTAMPTVHITGFDVLEDSVALARLRNPRGTFATGDIYNIAFPDRSFDV